MKNYILSIELIKLNLGNTQHIDELDNFFEESRKDELSSVKNEITQVQFEFIKNLLKSFWLFTKDNKNINGLIDELYNIVCDIDGSKEISILLFGKMCGLFMNNIMEIFNPNNPNNPNSSVGAGKRRFIELTTNNN